MDSGLIKEFEEARDKKEAEKQNGKCKKFASICIHLNSDSSVIVVVSKDCK